MTMGTLRLRAASRRDAGGFGSADRTYSLGPGVADILAAASHIAVPVGRFCEAMHAPHTGGAKYDGPGARLSLDRAPDRRDVHRQ